MNFDEALRHMQEGTATDEEKAYVEAKLQSANRTVQSNSPRVIENPKPARVKGQKRELGKFFKLVIVIAAIFVVLGAIFAGVFGSAAVSANKAEKIGRNEAGELARAFAFEIAKDGNMGLPLVNTIDDITISDIDRDLQYDAAKPANSFNLYEVCLNAMGVEMEIDVDTRTGDCTVRSIG